MGWLKKAFDFIAGSQITQLILIGIGALLGFKAVQWKARMDGENAQKQKQQVESLKEQAKVAETRRTIEESRNADIEQAREAGRSLPPFSGPSELWDKSPDVAGELFGNRADGSGQATGR